jgi:hypothetical protein
MSDKPIGEEEWGPNRKDPLAEVVNKFGQSISKPTPFVRRPLGLGERTPGILDYIDGAKENKKEVKKQVTNTVGKKSLVVKKDNTGLPTIGTQTNTDNPMENSFIEANKIADQGRNINTKEIQPDTTTTEQGGLPTMPQVRFDPEAERFTADIRRNYEHASNALTARANSLTQQLLNGWSTGSRKTQDLNELKQINENLSTILQGASAFHTGIQQVDIEKLSKGELPTEELKSKLGLVPSEIAKTEAETTKFKASADFDKAQSTETLKKAQGLSPSWAETKDLELGKVDLARQNERYKAFQSGLSEVSKANYNSDEERQAAISRYLQSSPEFGGTATSEQMVPVDKNPGVYKKGNKYYVKE